jgi:hypothetical protein
MVLACEQPMTGYHETNYSNAYGSHITWQNADSPVPNDTNSNICMRFCRVRTADRFLRKQWKNGPRCGPYRSACCFWKPYEMYPSLAFDSLFENRGSLRNLSVLDRVKDRATQLSKQVSSTDKAKLDEYLTSVRDVEKRIERMREDKTKAEDRADGRPLFAMERPANGLPEDFREHTRLMCDIIAMAFQTDKTRIASLILARDLSSLIYPFLGVNQAHHGASHLDAPLAFNTPCSAGGGCGAAAPVSRWPAGWPRLVPARR